MRNHGLLTWGETVPQAFFLMWTLHRACEIQMATGATGAPPVRIPESVCEQTARDTFREVFLGL